MSKGFISGTVLLILGLVCGLLLATINSFTAPKILETENKVKYDAIAEFYNLANYTIEEVKVENSIVDTLYLLTNTTTNSLDSIVYSVKQYGYQSDIKMLIAINGDYTVHGYKVVEQAETPGYGSKSVGFDFGLEGESIDNIDAFDAIAGATYSSNAVKDCFEAVFDRVASDFGGGN